MPQPLSDLIQKVGSQIRATGTSVVFAESCTAGLVSATLARVPGISEFHCGSAVVYQLATKTGWLGIGDDLLQKEGAVSDKVASEMAQRVLERTPAATLAASVTGHLGPGAPSSQDGLIYIGIAVRTRSGCDVKVVRDVLPAEMTCPIVGVDSLREWRQWKATEEVFTQVLIALELLAKK